MAPKKKKVLESEDSQTPLSERDADDTPNLRFWLSQHEAAKRAGDNWLRLADEAWKEYLGDGSYSQTIRGSTILPECEPRFPVFWSSIRTMQPAIYSRTPITEAQKMFDSLDDNMARLGSISIERLSKYLIHDTPFDRTEYATRDDFLLTGRATNRVIVDAEIRTTPKKIYYTETQVPLPPQPTPPQTDLSQPPAPPSPPQFQNVWINNKDEEEQLQDPSQLQQDEQGSYLEHETEVDENVEYVCVGLQPLSYKDIRHTPNARHWEEMDWISFKTLMTKPEVEKRFTKELADQIPFTKKGLRKGVDGKDNNDLLPTLYAEVWETWNKSRKEVMWHVEDWEQKFLDIQPDIYELAEFYPCVPFMLGTQGPDSMYPIPDYMQLRPQITQLHAMARRYQGLISAIKRRGLADATIPELGSLSGSAEGDFIMVKNFQQQIVGKGGIENVIQFFPTQEYARAITELQQAMADYEAKFNELYGIPDILRGVSDPRETAAAQQLKGQYLSLRFSSVQREFQRLVRDGIELMVDLALKKFPEEKLREVIGVRYWEQEDQQLWPQVLLLLQDDDQRKIRIDIQTDSTISMNQNAEIERANFIAKTITDGVATIGATKQQDPTFMAVVINALLMVVDKIPYGKEFSHDLRKAKDAIMQQIANPQPPQPPIQLQVEQMKQQGKQQEMQMKGQMDQQKMQSDFQLKQAESQSKMQLEQVQAQADMEVEMTKIRAEIQQSSIESQQKMQLEKVLGMMEIQMKAMELKMKHQEHKMDMVHTQHDNQQSRQLKEFETKENIKLMNKKAEHAYEAKP